MNIIRCILFKLSSKLPSKLRMGLYKLAGMKIGSHTRITQGFYVDRPEDFCIGDYCFLNSFVHCYNGAKDARILIGDNVYIGPDVKIICISHEMGKSNQRAGKNIYDTIEIEDGVWIGASVTILPGVKIAKGGVIGAGAVITKSTEPDGLYLGIPAKRIKDLS